jgi:hypothetical protein
MHYQADVCHGMCLLDFLQAVVVEQEDKQINP